MKKTTVIMVLLLLFTFDLSAKKKLTLIPTSHKTQKLEMGKEEAIKACEAGNAKACGVVGNGYNYGRDGYENNRKIAVKYYKLGCDGQDILSCSRLAIFYQKEDTLKKKALRLLEDTCKRANLSQTHDYSACSSAGEAYRYGTGTDKNLMMAISYYKISCERDRVLYNLAKNESSFSCKDLKSTQAELKNQGKSKPYLEKAISLLKEECENKHNVLSCKHLSGIYDKGKGVDIDKNMALKYTKKSNIFQEEDCLNGDGNSCWRSAYVYKGKKDIKNTILFAEKGAKLGEYRGLEAVGRMYLEGIGTEANREKSNIFYERMVKGLKKKCLMGDATVCASLASAYKYGNGVQKSESSKNNYNKMACAFGDSWSCYIVGKKDKYDRLKKKKCLEGDGLACQYLKIEGAKELAAEAYKKGCDKNDGESCYRYSKLIEFTK